MMAIPMEMDSKRLVKKKKKKRKENWGLLFTSPLKDEIETFQAVAVQQRPRTKSVMHVQIKLLFCSFKPIVVHGLFCRHCLCFKSCPTEYSHGLQKDVPYCSQGH